MGWNAGAAENNSADAGRMPNLSGHSFAEDGSLHLAAGGKVEGTSEDLLVMKKRKTMPGGLKTMVVHSDLIEFRLECPLHKLEN